MQYFKFLNLSNRNVVGAIWMVFGVLFFAETAILIKLLGDKLHTFQIVFFRCLFGLIVVGPLIIKSGSNIFKIEKPLLHTIRVICAIIGMSAGFYAITKLELATAVALAFTRPLFMIILAIFILKEFVGWRRGVATLIGFIGVLIIVQPGSTEFNPAILSGLLSAVAVGSALISVKLIVPYDSPEKIMLTFSFGTVIVSIIPAVLVWRIPDNYELILLVSLGIFASLGQYCTIRAYESGEATLMSPIDYLQIIFLSLAGFYIFNEIPIISTFIGASIIILSTLYIIVRGAKKDVSPSPPSGPALSP